MSTTTTTLLTIGIIAERLHEPIHRIEYVLRTRNIPAKSIAGNARVYDEKDLDQIANELRDIDDKKDSNSTR